ncbi:tautomerase PptA [Enterobacillus tribolii]|uniref:4-oxalocrotonate tautomerase n=1 Tax=Enterobacillus tribolii TaxID=1487935 RepID=A0A370QHV9_9GAMM|nr:tautomerase PptA [Enterobacillus tribolii]MBW7982674.1 tautomerase PptA [Enterobacillus tribolii]RDK87953.1 4-oxalocrotonate tautomerase [Enterobacillus tribolii]
MPHIDVKFFPQDLSDFQKQELVSDLCNVLKAHLGSKDGSISVALTEVSADRWKEEVYDPVIKPALGRLAKKPGYTL